MGGICIFSMEMKLMIIVWIGIFIYEFKKNNKKYTFM